MSVVHLDVGPDAYELRLDSEVVARLDGGAAALLTGAGERLREIDIEAVIERAEEWLMPFSKRIEGLDLRVHDDTGRVRRCLGDQASFTTNEVEDAFNRVHDAVVRAKAVDRDSVADAVLLRELAHHARLRRVELAPV